MTAEQIARLLHARKVGKGKWVAKCVAHPDRKPSLAIAQGRQGVLLCCMSQRCSTKAILDAAGLKWGDIFDGAPTREVRERLGLQEQRERLERQLGLVAVLGAIDKGKRLYWAGAERRIRTELDTLRCRIEPEQVVFERCARWYRDRAKQVGWEKVWKETYGDDSTAVRARKGADAVRSDGIHRRSHPLQDGRVRQDAPVVEAGARADLGHRGHMGAGDGRA